MIASAPVTVTGSEGDLRILFGNLIDNAVKYTPASGTVDVAVIVWEGAFRVEITDTGPGVEPAMLPRVFDRFVRAAPQGIEGSGLGLAIGKAIAERHDLRLTIENRTDGMGVRASVEGSVA
jgi:two-component system OmpR family sensor kinase